MFPRHHRRTAFTEKCKGRKAVPLPASAGGYLVRADQSGKWLKKCKGKGKGETWLNAMGKAVSKGLVRSGKEFGSPFNVCFLGKRGELSSTSPFLSEEFWVGHGRQQCAARLGLCWADREKVVVGTVNKPGSYMLTIKVHFVNSKFTQQIFFSES